MSWISWGFKDMPFKTIPISSDTLELFVGHKREIELCNKVINEREARIVIEGARGVGTTSFANYIRFSSEKKKLHFTPKNEIRVEPGWQLETLLSSVISNIVRELEFREESVLKDKRYIEAKALSQRISEIYKSFGVNILGLGGNYGQSPAISQPTIVPSNVLGHHLEDLGDLVTELGYKNGLLIQLNNLDIGQVHKEEYLKYLFNVFRDYMQTKNINWLFVGDVGLRSFISKNVDRVDDIIDFETQINPLPVKEYEALVKRRLDFYKISEKAFFPLEDKVFSYLYEITEGRLRYIFGLVNRLIFNLHVGDLIDKVTVDIAKPIIRNLARDRIKRVDLNDTEEQILKILVSKRKSNIKNLINYTSKSRVLISKTMNKFLKEKLVAMEKKGAGRIYTPLLDAKIAYSD